MGAILFRAKELQCVSDFKSQSLWKLYSQLGYRKKEPYSISSEEPQLVPSLVKAHMQQTGLTPSDMATLLHLTEEEFLSRYVRTGTLKIAS